MPIIFDYQYFLYVLPALALVLWAQHRLKTTYAQASKLPGPMSGAGVARHVLDSAGLQDVGIEVVGGELSDHYDPRHRVVRLSQATYKGTDLASAGIAAHECGHAIQHAQHYVPLVVRNAAVPVASIGSRFAMLLFIMGFIFVNAATISSWFMLGGIVLFSGVVFFQVVNLPVEYNASARAKEQLVTLGIVPPDEMPMIRKVLSAAALTYVAGTLQSIMILLYMLSRYGDRR